MEAELNVSKSQQHSLVIGPGGVQVPGGVHDLFIEEIIPNVGKTESHPEHWLQRDLRGGRENKESLRYLPFGVLLGMEDIGKRS